MKSVLILIAALISFSTFAGTEVRRLEARPRWFGACYMLYDCEGGSIGSYNDDGCRAAGGHSINSGGMCFNL